MVAEACPLCRRRVLETDFEVTLLESQTEMWEAKGDSCKCRLCFVPKPGKRRSHQLVVAKQERPTHV
jgi:hypothetical protein